jgi:hypothetical protein
MTGKWSAHACASTLKAARTIADHVSEGVQLRVLDRQLRE